MSVKIQKKMRQQCTNYFLSGTNKLTTAKRCLLLLTKNKSRDKIVFNIIKSCLGASQKNKHENVAAFISTMEYFKV